jgi:pimeloyl-ACP methyl ester carboxylesterase/DNA-binding CsgD family transcriptional regulator
MEPLTRRQREVVSLVARGLTNREIAERLYLSERTVEGHVEQIRMKLGVRSRTQIVAWDLEDRVTSSVGVRPPEIRYARSGSVDIAYQVLGKAEAPDLLMFSSATLPIDAMSEQPMLDRFHRRLASFSRLIRFDLRGIGMSDPIAASDPPTLEQWARDAVAVLDAAGSEQATVFGPRDTSLHSIYLAATFPDRVRALVLVNGTARFARAPDYLIGVPPEILEDFLEVNMEPDAVERGFDILAVAAPSAVNDAAFRAWWVRAGNRGASPSTARAIQRAYVFSDVRQLLGLLRMPTLILHRRDNVFTRVGHGRFLAEHIAGAKYVELSGADDLYWIGDTKEMLDEIEEFVTGVRRGPLSDRSLMTVLFTETVVPTSNVALLGDSGWRDLLDRQEVSARRQLARFRGRLVKSTEAGVVATFDGPARAVRCACAIRDDAVERGLGIRAGVHTGEVEVRGEDVSGVAVHVAARMAALAHPRQVLVSRTVVDLMSGSGIATQELGEHALKGVPGRWRLFAVDG